MCIYRSFLGSEKGYDLPVYEEGCGQLYPAEEGRAGRSGGGGC